MHPGQGSGCLSVSRQPAPVRDARAAGLHDYNHKGQPTVRWAVLESLRYQLSSDGGSYRESQLALIRTFLLSSSPGERACSPPVPCATVSLTPLRTARRLCRRRAEHSAQGRETKAPDSTDLGPAHLCGVQRQWHLLLRHALQISPRLWQLQQGGSSGQVVPLEAVTSTVLPGLTALKLILFSVSATAWYLGRR